MRLATKDGDLSAFIAVGTGLSPAIDSFVRHIQASGGKIHGRQLRIVKGIWAALDGG